MSFSEGGRVVLLLTGSSLGMFAAILIHRITYTVASFKYLAIRHINSFVVLTELRLSKKKSQVVGPRTELSPVLRPIYISWFLLYFYDP